MLMLLAWISVLPFTRLPLTVTAAGNELGGLLKGQ
jgi:hypothetical protein